MPMTNTFHRKNLNQESMTDILLYGCDKINEHDNKDILYYTIILKSSKCFERPLIDHCLLKVYFIIIFII